jgi:hypothetical protein
MNFSSVAQRLPSGHEARVARAELSSGRLRGGSVYLVFVPILVAIGSFVSTRFIGLELAVSVVTAALTACLAAAFAGLGLAIRVAHRVKLLEQVVLSQADSAGGRV